MISDNCLKKEVMPMGKSQRNSHLRYEGIHRGENGLALVPGQMSGRRAPALRSVGVYPRQKETVALRLISSKRGQPVVMQVKKVY